MDNPENLQCVLCNESFDCKENLQTHFRKHGDPLFKKQHLSNFDSKSKNETSTDDSVSCDVCSEVFSSISKAITHKHKVHPSHNTKYFCPWCGKLFTMKHLYTKHITTSHESESPGSASFHCDSCNVDFHVYAAVNYHNKFFHRQDELPNIGYSKKQILLDQDLVQLFYCAFCGDEYVNKVNLHVHMSSDHGDENHAPDDILRCPLCDAVFYHLDAYEVHLTFHSNQDLYIGRDASETNDDISDYTLETVPPILENVENAEEAPTDEPQEDIIEADQLFKLLQDSQNNDVEDEVNDRQKKKKKHKKHKKSKKETITLDEFLNMNTDLFEEGVDVHGIEEVPSQVVKKQLTIRKKPFVTKLPNSDIARLQKQGITIKPKVNKVKISPHVFKSNSDKVAQQIRNQNTTSKIIPKPTNQSHSDVISKLLSSGLSVTKKPKPEIKSTDVINDKGDNLGFSGESNVRSNSNESETLGEKTLSLTNSQSETNEKSNVLENNSDNIKCDSDKIENNTVLRSEAKTPSDIMKKLSKNVVIKPLKPSPSKPQLIPTEFNQIVLYDPEVAEKSLMESKSKTADCDSDLGKPLKSDKETNHSKLKLNHLETLKSLGITVKSSKKEVAPEPTQQPSLTDDSVFKTPSSIIKRVPISKNISNIKKGFNNGNSPPSHETINSNKLQTIERPEHDVSPQSNQDTENRKDKSDPSFLKNINSQITIKSVKPRVDVQEQSTTRNQDIDEFDDIEDQIPSCQVINQKLSPTLSPTKNLTVKSNIVKTPSNVPKQLMNFPKSEHNNQNSIKMPHKDSHESKDSHAVLRNLSQLTIKPINQQNKIDKHDEIFKDDERDIDDKDVDTLEDQNKQVIKQNEKKMILTDNKDLKNTADNIVQTQKAMAGNHQNHILKKLGGGITIKSPNVKPNVQSSVPKKVINESDILQIDDSDSDEFNHQPAQKRNDNKKSIQNKNLSVLQNLSKLVTVKAVKNSSSEDEHQFDDEDFDYQSDTDEQISTSKSNLVGKKVIHREHSIKQDNSKLLPTEDNLVAIYKPPNESSDEEIADCPEDMSDEEFFGTVDEYSAQNHSMNALRDLDFDNDDVENDDNSVRSTLNKLKNINPNLCVKPPNNDQPSTSKVQQPKPSANNRMGLKRAADTDGEHMQHGKVKQIRHIQNPSQSRAVNQTAISNKLATSQTVNQEVTTSVRTVQTKTVVQEITTTVTKTIKTVNQVEQQASNSSNNIRTINTQGPRIVQGIRPRFANSLRPRAPSVSTRPRQPPNINPTLRGTNTTFRHPTTRFIRPQNPITKMGPTRFANPIVNKQLKMSPNIVNQTSQTSNSLRTESITQQGSNVAKSSFVSQTNLSSSKTVQSDNASQVKTVETCSTSQQQFSKLNNIAGLKIMKNSQSQQQNVKSLEISNIDVGKRSAIDAIEKLRKQGLLVKKPRIEEEHAPCDSDPEEFYSDHEGDDS